jgi:hypothetical protein
MSKTINSRKARNNFSEMLDLAVQEKKGGDYQV